MQDGPEIQVSRRCPTSSPPPSPPHPSPQEVPPNSTQRLLPGSSVQEAPVALSHPGQVRHHSHASVGAHTEGACDKPPQLQRWHELWRGRCTAFPVISPGLERPRQGEDQGNFLKTMLLEFSSEEQARVSRRTTGDGT